MWRGGGSYNGPCNRKLLLLFVPFYVSIFYFPDFAFYFTQNKKNAAFNLPNIFFTHSRDESRILKFRKIKKGYFMKENILH